MSWQIGLMHAWQVEISLVNLGGASNSALDLSVRPVTPVAEAQRARQSVPQVSASVRQLWNA